MEGLGGRHRQAAGVSDESRPSVSLSSAQNTHPSLMELLETESRRWLGLVLKIGPLFPILGPHPGKVLGIFIWGGRSVGGGDESAGFRAESAPFQAELPRLLADRACCWQAGEELFPRQTRC